MCKRREYRRRSGARSPNKQLNDNPFISLKSDCWMQTKDKNTEGQSFNGSPSWIAATPHYARGPSQLGSQPVTELCLRSRGQRDRNLLADDVFRAVGNFTFPAPLLQRFGSANLNNSVYSTHVRESELSRKTNYGWGLLRCLLRNYLTRVFEARRCSSKCSLKRSFWSSVLMTVIFHFIWFFFLEKFWASQVYLSFRQMPDEI